MNPARKLELETKVHLKFHNHEKCLLTLTFKTILRYYAKQAFTVSRHEIGTGGLFS